MVSVVDREEDGDFWEPAAASASSLTLNIMEATGKGFNVWMEKLTQIYRPDRPDKRNTSGVFDTLIIRID